MATMELIEDNTADATIVVVTGRLDSQSAQRFGERLNELQLAGQSRLLIEASRLSYIVSAGFRALLLAAKRAAEQGGWVALCGMTAQISRAIEVAGLGAALPSYPSREDAFEKLARC
jgi:anti-anti-sigma factor